MAYFVKRQSAISYQILLVSSVRPPQVSILMRVWMQSDLIPKHV